MIILFLLLYLAPWMLAACRSHHQSLAIFALNVLLGWTGLGWIIAFVWACTAVRPRLGS